MKSTGVLTLFYCLFSCSDAWLTWSKSYTLKAVLTVPAANLSEPYQVWLNGDTKMSRVDFYNGMDKIYRQWNELTNEFEYYKIHPETTKRNTIIDVCNSESGFETQMYAKNTYLPVKNFKFKNKDKVNGIEAEKWEYSYTSDPTLNTSITYTVWVTFKMEPVKTTIPHRYVYEMKYGNNLLDYFHHDYLLFEDAKPDDATVTKPLGLECKDISLAEKFHEEAFDPLLEYVDPELEHLRVSKVFDSFIKKHNKNYGNKIQHLRRLGIFKNNLRYINSINRQHRSFSLGVNHLADLTEKEMLLFMGTFHTDQEMDGVKNHDSDLDDDDDDISGDNVNSSFDWREYGAVTAVKDQTSLCGSCYAFTTAAAVESAAFIARGCRHLEELSEQAILDCSWGDGSPLGGNFGCSGGTYEYTLKWLKPQGLPTKAEYGPYLALEGRCHISNMTKLVIVNKYEALPRKKQVIKDTLRKNGPLLIAINTSPRSFMLYTSGVYNDPECHKEPDKRTHGVTLVGYGHQSDQEYWIIKNTFGESWGERGYMRLATKDNICGLKNYAYSVGFKKSRVENCQKK